MHEHMVLVDGYNVIRRSPQLAQAERRSLQHGRDALVTLLAARNTKRNVDLTVVFDGDQKSETRTVHLGISIVYSAAGCTADECIIRLACDAEARGQRVTVATDDAGIRAALGSFAPTTMHQSATQLNQQIHAPDRYRQKGYQHRMAMKQILATDAEPPDPKTRQSGNPRRAPRKRR
ncbi:MAG: NYN domain-containing protein [Ktedonobacterales bacterium]|nr:NYN domain-containing protein [Ktedonobacterales bacterium]